MGYRSDVSIIIRNEDFRGLLPTAKAQGEEVLRYAKTLLSWAHSIRQSEDYTTLYFEWVKWYDHYPEVQFIRDYIMDIPHSFIRIGENNSDIEEWSDAGDHYEMHTRAEVVRMIQLCETDKLLDLNELLRGVLD
ncbi:MAG: hypothetical protein FWD97_05030 [Defluviitaleaceae bacterium]|nr:hypothetical protein [Defluviitaleaceae bacterium]